MELFTHRFAGQRSQAARRAAERKLAYAMGEYREKAILIGVAIASVMSSQFLAQSAHAGWRTFIQEMQIISIAGYCNVLGNAHRYASSSNAWGDMVTSDCISLF